MTPRCVTRATALRALYATALLAGLSKQASAADRNDPVAPRAREERQANEPDPPKNPQIELRDNRAELDGELLPMNPYRGEFGADDRPHHLFVAADGHQPHSERLQFDRDRSVHVELRRPASGGSGAGEASKGLPSALKLRPRVREIDVEDPWQ